MARGYFVASSGNVTDEIIKAYIYNQDLQERMSDRTALQPARYNKEHKDSLLKYPN